MRTKRTSTITFFLLLLFPQLTGAQVVFERVLIETPKPYDLVVQAVESRGGRVTHQFTYVNAIGAMLPVTELEALRSQIGQAVMHKDVDLPSPRSVQPTAGREVRTQQIPSVVISPLATANGSVARQGQESLNNAGTRVEEVHSKGYTGSGIIVALVDSGIRPGFPLVESDGSVIGGEDFVGDGLGFSNIENAPHGTFVAGLISGNAEFVLSGQLLESVRRYAPGAVDESGKMSITGTAPSASIYAIRVFGPTAGAGAPVSVILSAIQRVIDLRRAYDQGSPQGINIQVANLSVGVSTLYAGRSLLDQSIDAMINADIVPVISGGNTGLSSMTISSPGSSFSALTVGAASFAANERIGTELETGPGGGLDMRPFSGTQTAWFSSRGPNADGRIDPDVLTSGMMDIGQGYCLVPKKKCPGELNFASGTSLSAPIASGVAAILRQAFPRATAFQIRNAIIAAANPNLIADGSTPIDQGKGIVDALGAFDLLAAGGIPRRLPPAGTPDEDVRNNLGDSGLIVRSGTVGPMTVGNLKPGQRADIVYDVRPGTKQIIVTVTNVTPSLPLPLQNSTFRDGLFVAIHSAKISSFGASGDYLVLGFPRTAQQFVLNDPDTGLMRITITGDWVNAGDVTAMVQVVPVVVPLPPVTASGSIRHNETIAIPISISEKVKSAEFLLSWEKDWSFYPTSDIDLILIDPKGSVITTGVTLAGPERVKIDSPRQGIWQMLIDGFNIPAGVDHYELRVFLDGVLAN